MEKYKLQINLLEAIAALLRINLLTKNALEYTRNTCVHN